MIYIVQVDKIEVVKPIDNSAMLGRFQDSFGGSDSGEFSLQADVQIIAVRSELRNPCQCLESSENRFQNQI